MTSIRPFVATLISAPNRSPVPGAISTGGDQCPRSLAAADVKKILPNPFTRAANTTSTRLRGASNAGAGYEPGPRNGGPAGPTGIFKQNEGKMQTRVG